MKNQLIKANKKNSSEASEKQQTINDKRYIRIEYELSSSLKDGSMKCKP